uniref:Reverse transcriptase Ty1/copia-type domain-containing protein n=1 Tax=Tanacetum cinerariifolium TaxID=118510 RepID=A0A6L2L566_TANCI|nr:hypothetical protein [Tanacetum cinerariifolium]
MITVGSTMRILLLYRGEYSQWRERFMNYLEEQTDGEVMINSIQNGDHPLHTRKIDRLARSLLIQGLPNDIYSLIDSNDTAKDLWDALERQMCGFEYGKQDMKDHWFVEKTKVSKRKEKVVVQSESEGNDDEDIIDLKKITALLAKYFNRKKYYAKPTNNNLRTSSASSSANKKPEYVKSEEKKKDKNIESSSDLDQEINANMVFMAKIGKVLSDSDESSSSAEETITEKRIEKENQQRKYLQNQNKDLQDKYDVLINQVNTFEEKNNEFNEQKKALNKKNAALLAQTEVLQDQLKVKLVVIDTHTECLAQYAKLEEEIYEYMIRYSALCDNDKQHRKKIDEQEILSNKMCRQLVEMNNVLRLQEKILKKRNENFRIGRVCYENPSYFGKAKDLRPSLYDERVIGQGYTLIFLTHSDEALEIEKFKRARENKIKFTYDYGYLNASYVNEKINFLDDYFQEIINLDFEKIDSPFQQTISLKPHSKLNKDVKRYSRKDLLSCNNSHLGDTRSAYACNDAMNVSYNSSLYASYDENDLFIFDDVSIRNSQVSKMPFRKKTHDSLNVRSKRCSKHMTGNRALLTNFVEKFLGTVRFGNNDFAMIAGYGDVVIGSMMIKKVYYVETSNVKISLHEEEVFHESSESFQEESSSSSLNDDVQQTSTSHNMFNERLEDAYFDANTSFHDPSNVHTFYQTYPHKKIWIKDHPFHKIIGNPKLSVRTRGLLANSCLFSCLLSSIEPDNVAKALRDADWNKKDESSLVIQNKARLVDIGYSQQKGIDYDETLALVARIEAIRLFLAYATHNNFTVFQMDVKIVFLNRILKKEFLIDSGFQKGSIDTTLFIKNKALMVKRFEMSMMGEMKFFLGLQVNQFSNEIFINQSKYIFDILKRFRMENCDTVPTSMVEQAKLKLDLVGKQVDHTDYRSMIASLMYVTLSSQDIMFATCMCARYQENPIEHHVSAVKRIFHHLKGTINLGHWYLKDAGFDLTAYSDADHVGCHLD